MVDYFWTLQGIVDKIADDVPDNQSTIADGNSQDSTHDIAEITLVKRRYVGVENV